MPGVDFDTLRREIAMQQVLDLLGFQAASASGFQLRGPCPVHRSESCSNRSFSVNLETRRYQCFGCGSRGNQLELWAAARKLGICQAAIDLCQAAIDLCQALRRDVPWIRQW